jgi:nitroreductase
MSIPLDELLRLRHSVRAYEDRPVPRDHLRALCEAARSAPSACNSQTWRFVIVQDRAVIDRICDEAMLPVIRNRFIRQAPILVVGGSQLDIVANRIGSGVTGIEYYQIDLGIAMEHMVLKATELGLGTCWIGWFREKKVKEILHIPRNVRLSALLTVGYPREPMAGSPRSRKPIQEFTFLERWGNPFAE